MSQQALEPAAPPQRPPYTHVRAAAVAAMASDNGRKVHELPWLYLDSVGQEYGPVPGWTMREWLTLGRFPVGRDLRVRLPEWEQHLPLHQLFPDLSTAFVLPPSWPNIYVDEVLQGEEPNSRAALAAARGSAPQPAPEPEGSREAGEPEGQAASGSGAAPDSRSPGGSGSGSSQGGNNDGNGRWVSLPRLWLAGMKNHQLTPQQQQQQQPPPTTAPPQHPPLAQDRQLRHEEPMLPPPPPQPSQQQLRELLSQPQEGPPLWEDDRPYQRHGAAQLVGATPLICTGPHSANDAIRPVSF